MRFVDIKKDLEESQTYPLICKVISCCTSQMNVIKSTIIPSEMSWSGSKVALIGNMVFKCSTWVDILSTTVQQSPFPSHRLNFLLSLAISLFSPLPSFALYAPLSSLLSLFPPTPVPRSLSLSPPQREWVSVWLSGEERWVLPSQILFQRNSSSEKHVCLQRANAGLLLQFHKLRRSARHAEINTNPKTNKYAKGKQTSNVLPTLASFNPEPRNENIEKSASECSHAYTWFISM